MLLAAVCGFTLWNWSAAGIIHAKAWFAPLLIERAWHDSRVHHVDVKPWPWADTWPVARLSIPALDIEQFVLAGANGASLPFGPGHLSTSAQPGALGTIVIAGHRDTHFGFLPGLEPGMVIVIESRDGHRRRYRVSGRERIDTRDGPPVIDMVRDELLLVSCDPDNLFQARGPYRLIIYALPA